MTEGPTREETEQRLEAIFSSALEGEELEKMIASIPKRIEKFEGKWGGLIGWAEKKYGVPDESGDEPPTVEKPEAEDETAEEEEPEAEEKTKKKRGLMSRFRKKKEDPAAEEPIEEDAEPADGDQGGDPEGLDWEGPDGGDPEAEAEEPEAVSDIESALELIQNGESEAALSSLKAIVSADGSNPDAWRGMAAYFDSIGMSGRSKACEEKAESLS